MEVASTKDQNLIHRSLSHNALAGMLQQLRLTSECCSKPFSKLFERHLGLLRPESSLLTYFPISTWLADRLANPLSLAICCSDEALGIDVLRLLDCLCRHPLL